MTVETDLALRSGTVRKLVLRVDGLNYDFCQKADVAPTAAGTDGWRTPIECLLPPAEASAGLNIGDMKVDLNAMTFDLVNVYDTTPAKVGTANSPNTTYLLSQLFAPGRGGARTYIRQANDTDYYLEPDSSPITIYCDDTTDFPSSGTAYVGRHAFTYTGTGTSGSLKTFTGCTLGVYPSVGTSAFASAVRIDPNNEEGHQLGIPITQYPQTLLGRTVALYVATLDHATQTWSTFANSKLLWAGTIDDALIYDSARNVWQLSCSSVTTWLENREIGNGLRAAGLRGINLQGTHTFVRGFKQAINAGGVGTGIYTFTGTWAGKHYGDAQEILDDLVTAISSATSWSTGSEAPFVTDAVVKNGIAQLTLNNPTGAWINLNFNENLAFILGFNRSVFAGSGSTTIKLEGSSPVAKNFHPLDTDFNGSKLYTTVSSQELLSDQGDYTTTARAFVSCAARQLDSGGNPRTAIIAYTAASGSTDAILTLADPQPVQFPSGWWVGSRVGDGSLNLNNVYAIEHKPLGNTAATRGPFESLLYPLLSTGAADGAYNGAYDGCPPEFSVGVQAALVDTQSFLDADAAISGDGSAKREPYVAFHKPTPWIDLLQRECNLYGFFLCWSRGKLTLKRICTPELSTYVETLTESTNAQDVERPAITLSSENVINRLAVKPFYDAERDDYGKEEIVVEDIDSITLLDATHTLEVEHPGLLSQAVDTDTEVANLTKALVDQMAAWRLYLRYPMQKTTCSLGPHYAYRVHIGDIVRYQSNNHPDPYGSGAMAIDALGIVVDVAWDYATWTGRATLLLYSRADALLITPWAPAALVDIDSGWDSGNDRFTCEPLTYGISGDPDDGAAFEEDDVVYVIWTHPTDPASGETLGPFTVDSYDAANNWLYLKSSPSITLTAGREYVIVPADWASCGASQRARGLWQATSTTRKLSADEGLLYG